MKRPFGRGRTLLRGLTNHGYEPLTNWDDPPSSDGQVCQPLGCSKYSSTRPACFDAVFVGRGVFFQFLSHAFWFCFLRQKKPHPPTHRKSSIIFMPFSEWWKTHNRDPWQGTRWDILGEMDLSPRNNRNFFSLVISFFSGSVQCLVSQTPARCWVLSVYIEYRQTLTECWEQSRD